MTGRRIGILDEVDFSVEARRRLAALGNVEALGDQPLDAFLKDKDVLFVRLAYHVDVAFLAAAPRLTVIVSPTTGLTHIDLEACRARGVEVLSLKGEAEFLETISATPEHALGLILALLRNYTRAFHQPARPLLSRNALRGHDLKGSAIGLVGMGRVGRRLTRALLALDARVVFCDVCPSIAAPPGVQRCDSALEVAAACDVLVVAASHENDAPAVITADALDRLEGKYLVNIARGELVDETALIERIRRGHFAGVALDVIARETQPPNNLKVLLDLVPGRNLIITPHLGGATYESSWATEAFMVTKLQTLLGRAA